MLRTSLPVLRRRSWLLVLALCALIVPAVAVAALPQKGTNFEAHEHDTPGKNWHVQMEISKSNPKVITTLVLYAEACKATIAKENVPISDAGVVTASGTVKGGGNWKVDGTFTAPKTVEGVARLTKGTCDSGDLPYKGTVGDGHEDHDHGDAGGGHAGHHDHGPLFPDFSQANLHDMRQIIAMRRRSFQARNELFPTLGAALSQGFVMLGDKKAQRPLTFHVRNAAYASDQYLFNSRRPESLVYWYPSTGAPILLGMMFRAPVGPRPAFGGPVPIYHSHPPEDGSEPSSQMTHVWLTHDLKSAWSNCLPVKELELALPNFKYEKSTLGVANTQPCPSSTG